MNLFMNVCMFISVDEVLQSFASLSGIAYKGSEKEDMKARL